MSKVGFLVLIVLGLAGCNSKSSIDSNIDSLEYDSTLAKQLGADKFGMKEYTVCFLNPGPPTIIENKEMHRLNKQHFGLISELSKQGYLVLAGTFPKPKQHVEMLTFAVDEQKARELLQNDPKIQRGLLTMDFTKWYSSAALPELAKVHQRIDANAHSTSAHE